MFSIPNHRLEGRGSLCRRLAPLIRFGGGSAGRHAHCSLPVPLAVLPVALLPVLLLGPLDLLLGVPLLVSLRASGVPVFS